MASDTPTDTYTYKDVEFDNTDGVQMGSEDNAGVYRDKVTTYDYKGKRIPVPIRWHPNSVIRRIVEHNKRSQYTGVTMIGMCVVAGSKVVLGDGSIVNIENIAKTHNDSINMPVRISESSNATATKFFKYEKQKTLEIVTSGGKSVRGTYNHPLLVTRNGKTDWVQLGDIKKGDIVETVKDIPCNIQKMAPTNFNSNFKYSTKTLPKINKYGAGYAGKIPQYVDYQLASVMGYIIGDGYVRENNKGVGFVIAPNESDLEPILSEYMDNLFNIKPYTSARKPVTGCINGRTFTRTQTLREISYYSKPVTKMLSFLRDKRIPEMILCSPNPILSKFLSWYFEADGCCVNFKTPHRRVITVDLTSVDVNLLRDVQIALLRFGIESKIKRRNKVENAYKLTITRKQSILKFHAHIGFQSLKKRKQSVKAVEQLKSKRYQKSHYVDTVTDIIPHYELVDVYDIHVPVAHSFLTNGGVISHNSGTGKTTLTNKIIHQAHVMGENYIVKRYNGHDMLKIDQKIKEMTVGLPHILVFDDASYTMEDAKKEDIAKLANALTTIRHVLKSRVIVIINFHYSKATKKFFRNQHFTFLTSISVEELSNYNDMYKDKTNVVRQFARKYNNMTLRGNFSVPVSSFEKKIITYKMNEPFRIALVAEIADLHFIVYDKDACSACLPEKPRKKKLNLQTADDIVKHIKLTHPNHSSARTAMMFYLTIKTGKNYLKGSFVNGWRHLQEIDKLGINSETWDEVWKKYNEQSKAKVSKGTSRAKTIRNLSVMELAQQIKRDEEKPQEVPPEPSKEFTEKVENIEKTPNVNPSDYDSYYTSPP